MKLTDEQIESLRKLASAATPGPWGTKQLEAKDGWPANVAIAATAGRQKIYAQPPGGTYPHADQQFIAAANPAAVIALLDRLERAELELASIRAVSDPDNELSIESTTRDRMMHWCEAAGHLPRLNRLVEEARSERDAARKGWSGEAQTHDEFRAQTGQLCDRLMRERDAALADVERLTKQGDEARSKLTCALLDQFKAEQERDVALTHVNELRKERDAAGAEVERLKAEIDNASRLAIPLNGVERIAEDAERETAERIAAWADDEAEAMDIAWKHAPTTREADACRQEAASLRQFAVDIRAGARKEQGK